MTTWLSKISLFFFVFCMVVSPCYNSRLTPLAPIYQEENVRTKNLTSSRREESKRNDHHFFRPILRSFQSTYSSKTSVAVVTDNNPRSVKHSAKKNFLYKTNIEFWYKCLNYSSLEVSSWMKSSPCFILLSLASVFLLGCFHLRKILVLLFKLKLTNSVLLEDNFWDHPSSNRALQLHQHVLAVARGSWIEFI